MIWFLAWLLSGTLSVLLYALVSFWFDRHFVTSTWIMIWLAVMLLLGPLGCLLTLRFLVGLIQDVRRELRRRGLARYPRPARVYDAQARTLYFPRFAIRRLFERPAGRCQA
jgi:hypothetical protein